MNNILVLNGKLRSKQNGTQPGPPNIPNGSCVKSDRIQGILNDLREIIQYWDNQNLGFKPLVCAHYTKVTAKSNRLSELLSSPGIAPNKAIVGARFTEEGKSPKHIITYRVSKDCLQTTMKKLEMVLSIVENEFNGSISSEDLKQIAKDKKKPNDGRLSKTKFAQIVKDCFYIERLGLPIERTPASINDSQIVTLFDTGLNYDEVIRRLGLSSKPYGRLDDTTLLLDPSQYAELYSKAPYLIANEITDLRMVQPLDTTKSTANQYRSIPEPSIEPTIGVIDTLFDENVYFSKWVDFRCIVKEDLIDPEDYNHGTCISSLIVDGPALNPYLEDGCGRFRVRHFGVAKKGKNSSFEILENIKRIVNDNKDIKVWNLSLGSAEETSLYSISPEAAVLDQLQSENDIIFVVAGTNNEKRNVSFPRIGSPADSINAIVVNSVGFSGQPASYSRQGPVLCFFNKPDVSTFGGDVQDKMVVFSPNGEMKSYGTSFAAPWISRKLAYLIHIMKIPREVAKALVMDAAAGWNTDRKFQTLKGFGIVPKHITDILRTPDSEIKFIISGISREYDTYAYNIPVPESKDSYPFVCKATLCYFPKCSRNQGVDYTNTELDIHFGRIHSGKIKSIDNNIQGEPETFGVYESDARKNYRKWDNSKFICEGVEGRKKAKKKYTDSDFWGVSIKAKERLEDRSGEGLHFGLVVTLKEIEGKNRIHEFIQRCSASNWFVNEIDIETMNENYINEEAQIVFDD